MLLRAQLVLSVHLVVPVLVPELLLLLLLLPVILVSLRVLTEKPQWNQHQIQFINCPLKALTWR
jgi:hypothetical protein